MASLEIDGKLFSDVIPDSVDGRRETVTEPKLGVKSEAKVRSPIPARVSFV